MTGVLIYLAVGMGVAIGTFVESGPSCDGFGRPSVTTTLWHAIALILFWWLAAGWAFWEHRHEWRHWG